MQEILKGRKCFLGIDIAKVGAVQNAVKIDTHIISPSGVVSCVANGYDELEKVVGLMISGDVLNELGAYSIDLRLVFADSVIIVPTFAFAEAVEGEAPCYGISEVYVKIEGGEVLPSGSTTVELVNREEFEQLSSKVEDLEERVDEIVSGGGGGASTTYLELRELRNNGLLEPGAYYRITDFVTTTSKEGTKSAGHPFDIVVLALDERTLAEDAYAMLHEGDTYFANSNLSAWRLKYSFDNDFDRFEWAIEDTPEKPQEWKCSWGVLESKNNAEPSSNYLTAEVDGVTKYLYAPANRGTYLNNKTFYRELGTKDILSPNELIFEADDAPYEEDGYYSWEWISQMRARTADGTIVDRLYNDGGSEFYAEDDYNSGDWQYPVEFDPNPTYDEDREVYIYTISRGGDAWWNDYHGGKIEVVEKEQYNGSKDALFYAFDAPLPQTTTQAKPQIYSVETGHIYKSNNWSDTVRYSAYTPFQWNGGRGVIYGMLDEWQNEVGYDFKNILTTYNGKDYYTFSYVSGSTITDRTLACEYCVNNKIAPYIVNTSWNDNSVSGGRYRLGGIVFKDTTINKSLRNNFFGNGCNTIVLGSGCRDNYFGEFCTNITLGDNCYNNIFNKSCSYITLKSGSATTSSDAQYLIYCEFDVNTKYVQLWNSGTASSTQAVRYYRVSQSVSGTSSAVSVILVNRGQTTDTRLAKNSSGTIKQWCEADLA